MRYNAAKCIINPMKTFIFPWFLMGLMLFSTIFQVIDLNDSKKKIACGGLPHSHLAIFVFLFEKYVCFQKHAYFTRGVTIWTKCAKATITVVFCHCLVEPKHNSGQTILDTQLSILWISLNSIGFFICFLMNYFSKVWNPPPPLRDRSDEQRD